MAQESLIRLLDLSASLPSNLRNEQRELVQSLARELNVSLPDGAPVAREEKRGGSSVSAAREKFQKGETNGHANGNGNTVTRKEARKTTGGTSRSHHSAASNSGPAGNADCDISSSQIKNAYDQVRDDGTPLNWMLMGYGSSKKALELYGSGEGGLEELVANLKDDEVTYGYVRVIYGDSQRSKFVFVTYVPEGLSGMNRAKANMHKPAVIQFLKYMHIEVYASSKAELDEPLIQAKLAAAAGANYGTGGVAAVGSEDYTSIKDSARNFFQQTETKGDRVSVVYNKGPLAENTPVSLQGRSGITEKYITA